MNATNNGIQLPINGLSKPDTHLTLGFAQELLLEIQDYTIGLHASRPN